MHTAISTVGYGEMTPRSFLGRLITLPLLLFGLLLIALPSFVLGREFSAIWNDMASGHIQRTPYMQSELVRSSPPLSLSLASPVSRDEQFTQSPRFLAGLRVRQHASEEHLQAAAEFSATSTTSEHDETYHQVVQSQTALEAQLVEMRTAMDTQATLLRRIMEKVDAKDRKSVV